jgi:Na+/proline symporter
VAHATGSLTVLSAVRAAYTSGLDVMLWVCAGIAVTAALLAVLFLPQQEQPRDAGVADTGIPEVAGAE